MYHRQVGRSAPCTTRPRANLLGVGIDAVEMSVAVDRILGAIDVGANGYVCVTGVHGIMEAQRDGRFLAILNDSYLTTPDGMPTVWIGRLQGHPMRRVYGPDLLLAVCAAGVSRGLRHFFYGGNPGVARDLGERLRERVPGLQVVGSYSPPYRPLNAAEVSEVERLVKDSGADIVWVGLSTPKQEKFMADQYRRFESTIMIGVGAAFDIHTGRTAQAPRWMQRAGLEWLFRLGSEPRRLWRRYLINNPLFIARLLEQGLLPHRYPAPR